MKIAIIGAGVSGLVAAHLLDPLHDVTLYEAAPRLGGHVNTVDFRENGRPIPVDTGFIVFNTRTYPSFVRLLSRLGVAWVESDMSFGVSSPDGLAYGSRGLPGFFAQKRRAFSVRHWRMLADIPRFYRAARTFLAGSEGAAPTFGEFLAAGRYSAGFVDDHALPLAASVWSLGQGGAASLPARFVLRFFEHHGFLDLGRTVPWLTVAGGARTYVRAILAELRGQVHTGVPVAHITRPPKGGVLVDGDRFDHAIIACHADQALRLLTDASPLEQELLGAFPYQENPALLHTDVRIMPRERAAWSAWNYRTGTGPGTGARVTYWMNRLQPLGCQTQLLVTLNAQAGEIDESQVIAREAYTHPIFTQAGIAAQARHGELIAHRSTSYAGAYWRNGFHEDGVVSSLRACAPFGVTL